MAVIDQVQIRGAIRQAWEDSRPGTDLAREEGGFVLQDALGVLSVERWPMGQRSEIVVPQHSLGKRGNLTVVATFHTHPNLGPEFQQEPSLTDVRAVRDDPDLRNPEYEGEYVISAEWVYRIEPTGRVIRVAETGVLFGAD